MPATFQRLGLLVVTWLLVLAPVAMAAPTRNVLMLYSNNRLLPANIEADRGFREVLATSAERKVEVFTEFLDIPAFSGPVYEGTVANYLREKYATSPPEAIVVAGKEALDFLLRHRARLFPGVPLVHEGIEKAILQSRAVPADVIGVPAVYDFIGTIELALQWHPIARRLVIVTGTSPQDRDREVEIRSGLASVQLRPTVEFLVGLPTDVVLKRLGDLGAGDVVFTPGYFTDGAGRMFAPRESAALMAAASGAPVYGPFNTFIGIGVVGGRMPTFVDMGRQAAKGINSLLDGVPPAQVDLPAQVPAPVQVDWRQARKWGVADEDIPTDAIVYFKEPSFWEAHRQTAIIVAAVILLQAALIATLLIQRRLRQRTASALEESEKRMNLAARAGRLSMWIWDITRDKVWATPKLTPPAGASKETPVDFDRVLETVHPADREDFGRAVREAVAKGEELDVEYRMLQPGGEVRWFAARGRADSGAGERLIGVAMDITARKEAELQAGKDRAALTHMARVSMMGQLSAAIAHQLNQPLAAILGNAEAARKMLQRDHLDLAELKAICDDIVTEDNRAAEVIRRLGALYKRGELTFAPFDLNELVRETLDLVRTELLTRQVAAVTELDESLPPVDGGRVQLQQVLLNLILNGADSMGDIEAAERKLVIRTALDGANVRLCVVDQGTGIAPDNLRNVFDAFWSTKAGGIGIGLSICHSIITAHRGTLAATNNPGGGATLCATWPLRPTS